MKTVPSVRSKTSNHALPWRQLGAAFAISLIAHFALFMSAYEPFSLDFKNTVSLGGLRMRPIALPTDTLAQPAPMKPPAAPAAAKPALAPPTAPKAVESPAIPSEPLPLNTVPAPNPVQNEVSALRDTVQQASLTVVISLTTQPEATTSTLLTSAEAPPPLQLQLPSNVNLQFVATAMQRGQEREGRGQLMWQSDGQAYSLKIEASVLLLTVLEWSSVGKISEVGLTPERFSERRALRSEQAAHFRAELGKIQFSNNKPDAVLEAGAQDRLSVMLLLASLFAGSPGRIEPGSVIRMQVAGIDLAETWDIRYDGLEDVQLPIGWMKAHKLSRTPRREFDRKVELWLAPGLAFMPVRILQSSPSAPNDDYFDLRLSAVR